MTTIAEDVGKLAKEAQEKADEARKLQALAEAFPDIQKKVGRWNKVAYYSKTVNVKVKDFDMRHNCGCCNDSPLEVWPYLETEHGRIYSDPPCFQVGERHWVSGDVSYPGWKKKLRDAGISEVIIEALEGHFREDAEYRKELAEEDDYRDDDDD